MKKFSRSIHGYNVNEVNRFVDDVIRRVEAIIKEEESIKKELLDKDAKIKELETKKAQSLMGINGNNPAIAGGVNVPNITSVGNHLIKPDISYEGVSVPTSTRVEKKRNKSSTPVKPRKRKTNPEDDSLESSSNTKKQRKKGQK